MVAIQVRLVTLAHAKELFAKEDAQFKPNMYSEADIKRVYLRLVKKYHPDVEGGSNTKFQEVQQAYERLRADSDGFSLTEEDIQSMYETKQPQQGKVYKTDEQLRKEFE
jgi:DnaJ-class molecular chaperone